MTAIPDILDALVAKWRAATPAGLRPDQVLDGPPAGEYAGTEGVSVGASLEDNSAEFTRPIADMGAGAREDVNVTCLAWSGSGDTATKPRRDRVAAILAALEQVLAADRRLGGLVARVWLTSGAFQQQQTGRGALVTVEFRLNVTRL